MGQAEQFTINEALFHKIPDKPCLFIVSIRAVARLLWTNP